MTTKGLQEHTGSYKPNNSLQDGAIEYVIPPPLFVENIFGKCFVDISMMIEYLKCNFWVKNIFPMVKGVIVETIKISKCFNVPLVDTIKLCLESSDLVENV